MQMKLELKDEEVFRGLRGLELAAGSPPFKQLGQALVDSTKERFFEQQDPDGHPWAALSPATLQRKKVNADKILVEHQNLFNSITWEADATSVQVGTNMVYANALQDGNMGEGQSSRIRGAQNQRAHRFVRFRSANAGQGGTPARPFIGLSKADGQEILRIVTAHLQKGLGL